MSIHQRMEALRRGMTPERPTEPQADEDFQLDPALMPYIGNTSPQQQPALGGDVILPARPPSAKDAWQPAGTLPSRKRERDVFERDPCDQGRCFGCVYDLTGNSKNISRTDFKELCMVASR